MNAVEIEEAATTLAERPFDPVEFPFSFLEAFGNKETTLKRLLWQLLFMQLLAPCFSRGGDLAIEVQKPGFSRL